MKCVKVIELWLIGCSIAFSGAHRIFDKNEATFNRIQLSVQRRSAESDAYGDLMHESTESIWRFLDNSIKNLSFHPSGEAVLVLSNSDSGASTLTFHLTTIELQKFGLDERISFVEEEKVETLDMSPLCSDTTVPTLAIDTFAGINYYDCPEFTDTRDVAHDILATFSTKQLLENVHRVKFVFALDHSSFRSDSTFRNRFLSLARRAVHFLTNLDKYHNGIGFVVTRAQNIYTKNNGQFHLIDDQTMISSIADHLIRLKNALHALDDRSNDKILKFIEILLQKHGDEYLKIGISRLHAATVHELELLKNEKQHITTIVNQNLEYVEKANDDFAFELADVSRKRIPELIDFMQQHIMDDVTQIDEAINEFYVQQEKNITDVHAIDEHISAALLKLSHIRPGKPKIYKDQIKHAIHFLHIDIPHEYFNKFAKHLDYMEFLQSLSGQSNANHFQITSGLKCTMRNLNEGKKWYGFILRMYDVMDSYPAQDGAHVSDIAGLFVKCTVEEGKVTNINEIGMKTFLDRIGSDIYRMVENMQIDSYKLSALRTVLIQAMQKGVETSCAANQLIVRGYNIKLSDVVKIECLERATFIEVFALNKLFVDVDIDKTGQKAQISLIAPTWEIVGKRQILLSGKNVTVPPNATLKAEIGKSGEPGKPGGPAGHFLAIGSRFINDQDLEIVAVGGSGSDGQDAGDGMTFDLALNSI